MQKRNKTIVVTIVIAISILLVAFVLIVCLPKVNYEVGTFSLSKFYHPNEEVKVIENVGEIPDAHTATKKAIEFWTVIFKDDPTDGRPVEIYRDEIEKCWLVKVGPPKPEVIEGVEEMPLYECPYVIIRENGDVLKFGVS